MFPIAIVGRTSYRPYVTFFLLVSNVLVFATQILIGLQGEAAIINFIQTYALNTCAVGTEPVSLTVRNGFFSLFLHGSPMHLFGNMAFLWIFGPRVEEYLGRRRFLIFYLTMGFAAHVAHYYLGSFSCDTNAGGFVIGASGAIAGILGGFLFLHPGAKVRTAIILPIPFMRGVSLPFGTINVYAVFFLVLWLILDLIGAFTPAAPTGAQSGGVAHWAHIGGFIVGFIILFVMGMFKPVKRPDPLAHLDN